MQVDVWVIATYIFFIIVPNITFFYCFQILSATSDLSEFRTPPSQKKKRIQNTKPKMAETILSVFADEILGKLISVATEQISLAWGFREDLTRPLDSLEMIQDVLADAERRQESDRSVRRWLQRLKDVAYDADDVLDEFAYEILRRKVEIRNQMKRSYAFSFHFQIPLHSVSRWQTKLRLLVIH